MYNVHCTLYNAHNTFHHRSNISNVLAFGIIYIVSYDFLVTNNFTSL